MEGELMAILAWKPYASLEETQKAIEDLEVKPTIASHKYYLALPMQYLSQLSKQNTSDHLIYGAASMASIAPGSFTAPIAGKMLKQLGAQFVLIGTAYSRQLSDRDPETIRQKILKAIDAGLVPILCIGETIKDFENGRAEEVLRQQLSESVRDFTEREWKVLQIIYEAPWINATSSMPAWDILNQAYRKCRNLVQEICGVKLPVLCGVPDDITDLVAFVEGVQAEGYFFSHASLHLDIFSKGLHLSFPAKTVAPPPVEEKISAEETVAAVEEAVAKAPEAPELEAREVKKEKVEEVVAAVEEPEEVAEVVGTAVLAAAHEVEEQEVEELEIKEFAAKAEEAEPALEEAAEAPPALEGVVEAGEAAEAVEETPTVEEEVVEIPEEVPVVEEEAVMEEIQAPAEEVVEEYTAEESGEGAVRRHIGVSDISKAAKELKKLEEEL